MVEAGKASPMRHTPGFGKSDLFYTLKVPTEPNQAEQRLYAPPILATGSPEVGEETRD
jgi:hypothetical protein